MTTKPEKCKAKRSARSCTPRWIAAVNYLALFGAVAVGYVLGMPGSRNLPWPFAVGLGLLFAATTWIVEATLRRAVRNAHRCGFKAGADAAANELALSLGSVGVRVVRIDENGVEQL